MKRSLLLLIVFLHLVVPGTAQARKRKRSAVRTVERAIGYHPAILGSAARHGVDPRVLWTIAYLETRFRPGLVSPKGARGMMQFIPTTGRRYGLNTRNDFHDPSRSIEAAARYVRELSIMFGGRLDLVLAGYNAGENAVINWGYQVPPYRETRNYVLRGLSLFKRIAEDNIFAVDLPYQQQRPVSINPQPDTSYNTIYGTFPSQPTSPRRQSERSIYFSPR